MNGPMRGTACLKLCIACWSVALFLPSLPAQEQEPDISRAKASIQRLKQMPSAVASVEVTLHATNFGPYEKSGQCENFTWSLNFDEISKSFGRGFLGTQTDLLELIFKASQRFDSSYSPVKNWLVVTLPAFADTFDAASEQMLRYSEQSQTGTPEQVKAATANMEKSIDAMVADIKGGESDLQVGFRGLTDFNKEMTGLLDRVDRVRREEEVALAKTENLLKDVTIHGRHSQLTFFKNPANYGKPWPACAQADALLSYNEVRDRVRGQSNQVRAALDQALGVAPGGWKLFVPDILFRIVEIQRRYETVLARLQKAQITPEGAIQELHINTARKAVRNLANYARTELR